MAVRSLEVAAVFPSLCLFSSPLSCTKQKCMRRIYEPFTWKRTTFSTLYIIWYLKKTRLANSCGQQFQKYWSTLVQVLSSSSYILNYFIQRITPWSQIMSLYFATVYCVFAISLFRSSFFMFPTFLLLNSLPFISLLLFSLTSSRGFFLFHPPSSAVSILKSWETCTLHQPNWSDSLMNGTLILPRKFLH
jgi:hypothetical protein